MAQTSSSITSAAGTSTGNGDAVTELVDVTKLARRPARRSQPASASAVVSRIGSGAGTLLAAIRSKRSSQSCQRAPRIVHQPVRPGAVLEHFEFKGKRGVVRDRSLDYAHVSLFAPRATGVKLVASSRASCFDTPDLSGAVVSDLVLDPTEGVWAGCWNPVSTVCYYGFLVDGPRAGGEAFDGQAVAGDPYARAVVSDKGPCIAINPNSRINLTKNEILNA